VTGQLSERFPDSSLEPSA